MATKKKMLQAAAGNAGGEALNVEEVFSTYLYEGDDTNPSAKVNGIDLSGEGGMVWLKSRTGATNNYIADTEQPLSSGGGATWLYTNTTDAAIGSVGTGLLGFNSDGFSTFATGTGVNNSSHDYASWTFRKAPKFFDVVTYTGDGTAGREIAHNLGSEVGMVVVKKTNNQGGWHAWHRSSPTGSLRLDTTAEAYPSSTTRFYFGDTVNVIAPTDSVFTVSNNGEVNGNGDTYVAYLFAHNNGDGEFGPDGDADIIKCGSYTGNASANGPEIDLGFEPQWVMVKGATSTSGWTIVDSMRGMTVDGTVDPILYANFSNSEDTSGRFTPKASGFQVRSTSSYVNTSSQTYIYMAIRRGTKVPESGDEVFAQQLYYNASNPQYTSNFPVDMGIIKDVTGADGLVSSRLTQGKFNYLNTDAETTNSTVGVYDYQNGFSEFLSSTSVSWMWKRAPNFFDVVAYSGNSTAGRTVSHSLGVAPEMMWVKKRNNARDWKVYHSAVGNGIALELNATNVGADSPAFWNDTTPTESVFSLGTSDTVNASGDTYIAYLFATLAGVSKVGSYTGNGSNQTINCGFTSGARFILIKRTDSTGDWYVWDTERGIVAGNDPHLSLNTTAAEVTTDDSIDPDSSGFIVNQVGATNINVSSAEYIFYAVA